MLHLTQQSLDSGQASPLLRSSFHKKIDGPGFLSKRRHINCDLTNGLELEAKYKFNAEGYREIASRLMAQVTESQKNWTFLYDKPRESMMVVDRFARTCKGRLSVIYWPNGKTILKIKPSKNKKCYNKVHSIRERKIELTESRSGTVLRKPSASKLKELAGFAPAKVCHRLLVHKQMVWLRVGNSPHLYCISAKQYWQPCGDSLKLVKASAEVEYCGSKTKEERVKKPKKDVAQIVSEIQSIDKVVSDIIKRIKSDFVEIKALREDLRTL